MTSPEASASPADRPTSGVITLNAEGLITGLDHQAEGLLGRQAPDLIGQDATSLQDPVELAARAAELGVPAGFQVLRHQAENEAAGGRAWTFLHADGSPSALTVRLSAIRGEDQQPLQYVAVLAAASASDLSAELERYRKVSRSLLGVLSHDMRTPLTGIQGFSEMIRDEDWGAAEIKEFAEDIHRCALRMDAMIAEMLDLGRAELGPHP
jgi:signal transduction histidine kinase